MKRNILFLSVSFIVLFCEVSQAQVTVNTTPSTINIPRGQSGSRIITYQFTGDPSLNATLTSSGGSFVVGSETIETNTVICTVNIQNGSGKTSGAIDIPVRVLDRVIQRGTNKFSYMRTFTGPNITVDATIAFNITTEAGADFGISRISLYFENRRAEITVERNYPDLKAYADIRFVGSGLLQGYWEVDGRILSQVNQHLTYGRSVTLQTAEIPSITTGTHTVRFVITNPPTAIALPSILYFVTSTEFKSRSVGIKLISPADGSLIEYLPVKFEWENLNRTTLFLIQYFDKIDSKPVFSAYTRDNSYSLPEIVLNSILLPGRRYYWKVMGFDAENNIIGESEVWGFFIQESR